MSSGLIQVTTTRFGTVAVDPAKVITFPEGLIGFEKVKRYFIKPHPGAEDGAFMWLQSMDMPGLAFVVCNPFVFKPDYDPRFKDEELSAIKLGSWDIEAVRKGSHDGALVVILVVPKDPQGITANLQGPLVINHRERLGRQLVLSGPEYSTKYKIFASSEGRAD